MGKPCAVDDLILFLNLTLHFSYLFILVVKQSSKSCWKWFCYEINEGHNSEWCDYVTEQNMVRNTDPLLVSVCPTVQNASGVPLPPSHNGAYSGLLLSLLTSSSSLRKLTNKIHQNETQILVFFSKISPIIVPCGSSDHPSLLPPSSLLSSLTSPILFVPGRSRSMVLTLYCLVCPGPTFSVSLSQLPSHRGRHSSRLSVFLLRSSNWVVKATWQRETESARTYSQTAMPMRIIKKRLETSCPI